MNKLEKLTKLLKSVYFWVKSERDELDEYIKILESFNKLIKDLQKSIKEDKISCKEDFWEHCKREYRHWWKDYESIKRFVMDQDDIDCNMNYTVWDIWWAEWVLNKFISLIK